MAVVDTRGISREIFQKFEQVCWKILTWTENFWSQFVVNLDHNLFLTSHSTIADREFCFYFQQSLTPYTSSHFRQQKQSSLSTEDRLKLDELDKNMIKRKAQLYEIEQSLPQKNSLYLKVNKRTEVEHSIFCCKWKSCLMCFFADYPRKCKRIDSESFGKSSVQRRLREV